MGENSLLKNEHSSSNKKCTSSPKKKSIMRHIDVDESSSSKSEHSSYKIEDSSNFKKKSITKQIKVDGRLSKLKTVPSSKRLCVACNITFSSPSSLSNHKKKCKMIPITVNITQTDFDDMKTREIELKEEVRRLKNGSAKLEIANTHLHEKVDDLIKDKDRLMEKLIEKSDQFADRFADMADTNADLAKSSNSIASSSMSTLSYLARFIKNAPPLKPIDNISLMLDNFDSKYDFVLELVSLYRHNALIENIGKFIIRQYKKKDKNKQSLWNSDASRITYAISKQHRGSDTQWVRDYQGVIVSDMVVRPVLMYIKKLLQLFVQDKLDNSNSSKEEHKRIVLDIICLIDDHQLEGDIVKYIAPYLRLNEQQILDNKEEYSNESTPSINKKGQKSSKAPKNVRIVNKPNKITKLKHKVKAKVLESESGDESLDFDSD